MKKIAHTPADPTLQKIPFEIAGTTYSLCFDYGALAEAEAALNLEGHNVNLLMALPIPTLSTIRPLFAAALRTFHSEVSFEDATAMVTLANATLIGNLVVNAWISSRAEPEPVPTSAVPE
jgi:hypothetical protein